MTDACVTPVLSVEEAAEYRHNLERESFVKYSDGTLMPARAPRLSRFHESKTELPIPEKGEHSFEILAELGYGKEEIVKLGSDNVIKMIENSNL